MPMLPEIREAFAEIAREYGDRELLEAALEVVRNYAELGARQALTRRKGDRSIDCPECRARAAQLKHYNETMARLKTGRPLGGAVPATTNEEAE